MTPLRERGFPNPGQTFTGALHPQTMEVDARVSGSEVPPPGSRYVGITRAKHRTKCIQVIGYGDVAGAEHDVVSKRT